MFSGHMVNNIDKEQKWESILFLDIFKICSDQENGETVYGGELSEQLTEEIKQQWIAEGNYIVKQKAWSGMKNL